MREPVRIDGYAPIRDYAVIGNKRTAALVALDGAIDWLPLPGLAGPAVLGAVLDARRGGRLALAPDEPFEASRRYLPDTNVLETTFRTGGGEVRVTDAMSRPIAQPIAFDQVLRRIDGVSGEVRMTWRLEPAFDFGASAGAAAMRAGLPSFAHGRTVLAVESFDAGECTLRPDGAGSSFTTTPGSVALLALDAFVDEPLTRSTRDELLARLDDTADNWRRQAAEIAYDGPWRDAVLRSALALELLVDDATGAIAAAATMALPERMGGPRNFDYRYAWVRDANLTLEAMLNLGLREQVHTSLGWVLATTRRTHPRLRPMYQLDGEPRLPSYELDVDGYRGSRPVLVGNSAEDQLQLGNFGDVFDMTAKYIRAGNGLHPEAAVQLTESADHLCRVWRNPDAGIWELPDAAHYTQSKLACWTALDRAVELAQRGELPAAAAPRWRAEADRIVAFLRERCWSAATGSWARMADSDELDASVLLATRDSFLERDGDSLRRTIDAIRRELGAGGALLHRYSGMAGEEGAFVACSFWLVQALARSGRADEAAEAMDDMVARVNDVGLLSEEIDPSTGDFLGNLPQALSHLALINAACAVAQQR